LNVLILARGDWSGAGYALCQAINKNTEHHARQVAMDQYWTQYQADTLAPDDAQLRELLDWADVWNIHDDADSLIPAGVTHKPTVYTYHGTWYRRNHQAVNEKHSGRVQTCLTQDLARFGPTWLGRAQASLTSEQSAEFIVCHAPTKRRQKGTQSIVDALEGLAGVSLDIVEGIPHQECLKRKAKASVYIDQVGEAAIGYGTNSLEAWAMGMPVICWCPPEIEAKIIEAVGYLPYYKANTKDEIRTAVELFRDNPEEREKWAEIGRKYLAEHHAPKVVADRFIELCNRAVILHNCTESQTRRVSVCMIVRNEEAFLPWAINSTQGLADEVVILDTGSEDNSVQVAESLGARVILGGDRMNKGGSRNQVASEATGDWIVVLDADERITDPAGFRQYLMSSTASAVSIRITNVDANGNYTMAWDQVRAYQKGKCEYRYRAHEVPIVSGNTEFTNFVFEHRQPKERNSWKLQYTLDRLLLDVQETNSARQVYYLGRQYRYLNRIDEAIDTLKKYMEMSPRGWDAADCCFELAICFKAKGIIHEYESWLYRACSCRPDNRYWWYALAESYFSRGRFDLSAGCLRFVLEITKESGFSQTDPSKVYELLSRCLWKQRRYEEGRLYSGEALKLHPNDPHYQNNYRFFEEKVMQGATHGN